MENEKTIDVLNTLITINNDRIEGYETASDETEDFELKSLFTDFAETSHSCKRDLVGEVIRLGGEPAEGTMVSGKFYRIWMDIKAALTGKDRKAILNSCEYGEDIAVKTYKEALTDNFDDLTVDIQTLIQEQHNLIKADHDKVKSLRDSLIEVE
jgi:uncharacterized protein (TIGR02284 family)